eukprot:15466063-Alexandrium_andersonii.AAC.1
MSPATSSEACRAAAARVAVANACCDACTFGSPRVTELSSTTERSSAVAGGMRAAAHGQLAPRALTSGSLK